MTEFNDLKKDMENAMVTEFPVIQRGPMSPDSVYAQYQVIKTRPAVPYVPPPKLAEIPNGEKVMSVELKRVLIAAPVITGCAVVIANGATIIAFAAPYIAVVVVATVVFFLAMLVVSAFSGGGSGSDYRPKQGPTIINHYHQNNYQGNGGQNN